MLAYYWFIENSMNSLKTLIKVHLRVCSPFLNSQLQLSTSVESSTTQLLRLQQARNDIIFNKVDRLDSNAAVLAFISFLELNFENYHTLEWRPFRDARYESWNGQHTHCNWSLSSYFERGLRVKKKCQYTFKSLGNYLIDIV